MSQCARHYLDLCCFISLQYTGITFTLHRTEGQLLELLINVVNRVNSIKAGSLAVQEDEKPRSRLALASTNVCK